MTIQTRIEHREDQFQYNLRNFIVFGKDHQYGVSNQLNWNDESFTHYLYMIQRQYRLVFEEFMK